MGQISDGSLASDDLVNGIVKEELQKNHKNVIFILNQSWLLDGFPRSVPQACFLDKYLESKNLPISFAAFIDVEEEEIINRLKGRMVHLPSGRTYHLEYSPPKVEGIDDLTGEPLMKRKDDDLEVLLFNFRLLESEWTLLTSMLR